MTILPARLKSSCFVLATWFGAGLSPVAPGTVGTIAALPAHFVLSLLPDPAHLAALAMLTVLAVVCAGVLAGEAGQEDPQIVVVDEVVGVLLALLVIGDAGVMGVVAAVVLFRLFDIFKPWPIGALERLRPAGLGIVADDLAAGLVAGSIVLAASGLGA
ncbi:MAG: phosphatidylglycerophosphatase A [Alphaproteobacteria bacterium]|nr:phosphatidylglycerophosphatase A [Alphaproteobacteria bacterium]